jgi:hypothetical protein
MKGTCKKKRKKEKTNKQNEAASWKLLKWVRCIAADIDAT